VANPIYFCPSVCAAVAARCWIAGARRLDVSEPTREEERQFHSKQEEGFSFQIVGQ